ncbi:MAG: PEF-CTERM sorting domain-containing protein [Methanolobus sp.]|nr:PEF-CTERM sorting domain-containing protein [Methanolobus sp.]
MKKLLVLFIVALISMMGSAHALDVQIMNKEGTFALGDPIIMQPGQTLTFSIGLDDYDFAIAGNEHNYNITVFALSGGASVDDVTATLLETSVTPPSPAGLYVDEEVFTLTMDADAPGTGVWQVYLEVGEVGVSGVQFASATRNIEITEFPTIALPIAAILGFAFFMQRRNREE